MKKHNLISQSQILSFYNGQVTSLSWMDTGEVEKTRWSLWTSRMSSATFLVKMLPMTSTRFSRISTMSLSSKPSGPSHRLKRSMGTKLWHRDESSRSPSYQHSCKPLLQSTPSMREQHTYWSWMTPRCLSKKLASLLGSPALTSSPSTSTLRSISHSHTKISVLSGIWIK